VCQFAGTTIRTVAAAFTRPPRAGHASKPPSAPGPPPAGHRLPAEQFAGQGDVRATHGDILLAGGHELDLAAPGRLDDLLRQVAHGDLLAGAEVDRARLAAVELGQQSADQIIDVARRAGLLAVAV